MVEVFEGDTVGSLRDFFPESLVEIVETAREFCSLKRMKPPDDSHESICMLNHTEQPNCYKPVSRRLSISTDGGSQEIHQTIPDGVEIKKAVYGNGIFATKFFPKGSVVYVGSQIVIPNEYAEFRLVIENTGNSYSLNTDTHSVQFSDSERWLYLFDSFMNHSCSPTTISRQTPEQKRDNQYQTVALRDIHPGDEITCDYNLFEYDCHGKVIDQCLCGSPLCIGRVAGYKFLSREEQKRRIELVDTEVLIAMNLDPLNKFIYIPDLRCPTDRVGLEAIVDPLNTAADPHMRMVANRDFACGEIICQNESLIFPEDCAVVIEMFGNLGRKWLDNLVHTVNKGKGYREFYYFDSFQNHSCDPNSYMVYRNDNHYDLIASRDIRKGDEITSDYESFDDGLDGTSFTCACGTNKCRGIIKA